MVKDCFEIYCFEMGGFYYTLSSSCKQTFKNGQECIDFWNTFGGHSGSESSICVLAGILGGGYFSALQSELQFDLGRKSSNASLSSLWEHGTKNVTIVAALPISSDVFDTVGECDLVANTVVYPFYRGIKFGASTRTILYIFEFLKSINSYRNEWSNMINLLNLVSS